MAPTIPAGMTHVFQILKCLGSLQKLLTYVILTWIILV